MSRRAAKRMRAGSAYALAAVLVAMAIVVTALRLAVAYAPAFHDPIEALLARWLHRPVAISALDARLDGLTPVLILHGVRIGAGPGSQADLAAARLAVSIHPWQALLRLQPRFVELRIEELAITLTRLPHGRIVLGEQSKRPSHRLFASISRLRLQDASVTLIDQRRGQTWRLDELQARFWDNGRGYHLAAHFIPAQPRLASQVELIVRWRGEPRSLAEFSGSGYLHLRAARFDRISAVLPAAWGVSGAVGQGDIRLWMLVRQGQPDGVVMEASLHGFDLGAAAAHFQRVAGRGRWQRTGGGWKLDINALQLQRPGQPEGPSSALSVRYSTNGEGAGLWRARASALQLGDMAVLARASDWLPLKWRKRIARLTPRGDIRDPSLVIQATSQGPRWRLSGRFHGLAVQPAGRWPGLSAGAGEFLLTDCGGRLRLAARHTSVMLPELLPRALALERLQMQSKWRLAGGRLQLVIPRLRASSSVGALDARLRLWLGGPQGPFIDARARLRRGDVGRIRHYLPARVMAEELHRWLHDAVRSGRIEADLVIRGWLRDFPYRKGGGVFDVQARVSDVSLAYLPGWPMLHGLNARLSFHQGAFAAELSRGRIYRSRLLHATLEIPDLRRPRLVVRGRLTGPGADLLRFLRESPLAHEHEAVLRQISLSGQSRLGLQLVIPFSAQPIDVDGWIDLAGARLAADNLGLAIDELTGRLGFDENGVYWDRLRGRFNGHMLVSRAVTSGPPGDQRIRIDTRFRSSLAGLLGTGNPLAAQLSGITDWRLEITASGFRSAEPRLDVVLESALRGVRVDWPQPLAKPPPVPRRLRIQTRLDSTGLGPIHVRYAQAGSAVLALAPHAWAVERLGVHFGHGQARLPKHPGTRLTGRLERLDLADLAGLRLGESALALPPLRVVDVQVGTLAWGDTPLVQALHMSAKRLPDDWLIHLAGPNAAGWIHWPRYEGARAAVNLARLNLAGLAGLGAGVDQFPVSASLNVPGIDLAIADLRVGGRRFGHFSMHLERVSDGLVLEAMQLNGPVLEANATGRWSAGGLRGHSAVDLSVFSGNTGKALGLFGFARAIGNGTTTARAHLRWPGTLLEFTPARVSGEVRFTIRDGSLLQVQPGAGRIFGLLSVASLPRRLALDFSDLFGKGLVFDRIKARFRLENGIARPEIFYIDCPAARIEVSGPIDLVRRQYDQTVTVVPRFTAMVSLLGGLAGGPLTGIILFLSQKLLQADMVGRLAQNRYRITGSWAHPRIQSVEPAWADVPGVIHDPK